MVNSWLEKRMANKGIEWDHWQARGPSCLPLRRRRRPSASSMKRSLIWHRANDSSWPTPTVEAAGSNGRSRSTASRRGPAGVRPTRPVSPPPANARLILEAVGHSWTGTGGSRPKGVIGIVLSRQDAAREVTSVPLHPLVRPNPSSASPCSRQPSPWAFHR